MTKLSYLFTICGIVIACSSAYTFGHSVGNRSGYEAGRGTGPILHYVADDIEGCEWPPVDKSKIEHEYTEDGAAIVADETDPAHGYIQTVAITPWEKFEMANGWQRVAIDCGEYHLTYYQHPESGDTWGAAAETNLP